MICRISDCCSRSNFSEEGKDRHTIVRCWKSRGRGKRGASTVSWAAWAISGAILRQIARLRRELHRRHTTWLDASGIGARRMAGASGCGACALASGSARWRTTRRVSRDLFRSRRLVDAARRSRDSHSTRGESRRRRLGFTAAASSSRVWGRKGGGHGTLTRLVGGAGSGGRCYPRDCQRLRTRMCRESKVARRSEVVH